MDGTIDQLYRGRPALKRPTPPSPYGLKRKGLLEAVKLICRTLPSNGSSLIRLDETTLLGKAFRLTGLDDLGDESFYEALRFLLNSLESDARLNFIGRICAHSHVLRLLCNRLCMREDRRRYPQIADQVITRPLFITGLPRTGSTLLHCLLAQDVSSRAPQVWEVMHPSPPPKTATYRHNPRIARTSNELRWLDILMPDFKKVHLLDARLPQECIAITGHSFVSYVFETMFFVSSYRRWHGTRDQLPAYECHKGFLQHLQWRCPGTHWVLKAPSHLFALDALMQVYPDARIIMTHRDPLKVLASCASFTEVLREPFVDHLDREDLGTEIARHWEKGAHLAVRFRRDNGDRQGRFLDVWYEDLVTNPMAVVEFIYRHFDMELTDKSKRAMLRFLADNRQHKNGVHRYSLEEFGLDCRKERQRFQFYTDYFGVAPESR